MSKHNKNESYFEEGTLTVKCSGEIDVKLDFVPNVIEAIFLDEEPNHGCCDVSTPDVISITEKGETFVIAWSIKSQRTIKWVAKKHK